MKYFSLFSGIGGLESGLNKVADCVGISEIKKSSIKVYKKNYGVVNNFGDIKKIDPKSLPNFDILIGGFPCQSFSLLGSRKGFDDQRGKMIFRIYDILKEKKPQFVVLENVKGILNHSGGQTYKNVVNLLSYLGYFVRVLLLNSVHYGSAQNRERVFFLCSKDDFDRKEPIIIDDTKRFKDIRDKKGSFVFIEKTKQNLEKINQKRQFNFELIGGYDRVGTLTTGKGCGEKLVYEENVDDWRFLTILECERLMGFSDNSTAGISENSRYFALGNAVNCDVSNYLFNDYLKDLWFKKIQGGIKWKKQN